VQVREWKAKVKEVEHKLKDQTKLTEKAEKIATKAVLDAKKEVDAKEHELKQIKVLRCAVPSILAACVSPSCVHP
jgi:hypothetical protein